MDKIKIESPRYISALAADEYIEPDEGARRNLNRIFESSLNDQIEKAIKCIPLYVHEYIVDDNILTVGTPTSRYSVCNKKTLNKMIERYGDKFSQLYKVIEIEGVKI